ncbi:MAG TPA: hypothetical protein VE974_19365 [Thermoanaerobaculia bacterium]|nr:hypothetical protein [Thermoanaerobaculia bacterium]
MRRRKSHQTTIFNLAVIGVLGFVRCDGFVGEASVTSSTKQQFASIEATQSQPVETPVDIASFDTRQLSLRFEGADDATVVNPGMNYRFVLAASNNSRDVLTGLRGVISVRSKNGSDLLVNHPFMVSGLRLAPGATERLTLDIPVPADVARHSELRFEVISVQRGSQVTH